MGRGKSQKSLDLVDAAYAILEEIQPATVRAVCYRLFVQGVIGSMSKANTNRVSRQLTWARERGAIPWGWIVDETREAERVASWDDPEGILLAAQRQYRKDRWALQRYHVEVWSEKGTVRGTLVPVLNEYGVTFRVMHGYASATAVYQAVTESLKLKRPFAALYVGDWDPSGLHMSEVDLSERLSQYRLDEVARCLWDDVSDEALEQIPRIEVVRVALAEEDVDDPALPAFEAETKRGDPRWGWYVSHYGQRCWELDALSPIVLRERVEDAIRALIDWEAWERCGRAEAAERESLAAVLGEWRNAKTRQASE